MEALLGLSEELRQLSLGGEVPRVRSPLPPLDFYRDCVAPNRPCVITGSLSHWPALRLWSNAYLLEKMGAAAVTVAFTPSGRGDAVVDEAEMERDYGCLVRHAGEGPLGEGPGVGDTRESSSSCTNASPTHDEQAGGAWGAGDAPAPRQVSHAGGGAAEQPALSTAQEASSRRAAPEIREAADGGAAAGRRRQWFVTPHERTMPFADFVRQLAVRGATSAEGVPYAQPQNGSLHTEYAALAGDVEGELPWASEALGCRPEAVNFWMGDERAVTSFHKDHYENLYAVVAGAKRFTLLPPGDFFRLYVRRWPAARFRQDQGPGRRAVRDCSRGGRLHSSLEPRGP